MWLYCVVTVYQFVCYFIFICFIICKISSCTFCNSAIVSYILSKVVDFDVAGEKKHTRNEYKSVIKNTQKDLEVFAC